MTVEETEDDTVRELGATVERLASDYGIRTRLDVGRGSPVAALLGHQDEAALNIQRPDAEPRATRYVPQMLAMISRLQANGFAYRADLFAEAGLPYRLLHAVVRGRYARAERRAFRYGGLVGAV